MNITRRHQYLFHHARAHLLLASMLCMLCAAQAQRYPIRRYSTSDGLSQNHVSALAQDHRGFVWIGTSENGLNRFDGREFISFDLRDGLRSNTITALAVSDIDELFIGTDAGVVVFALGEHADDRLDFKATKQLQPIMQPVEKMSFSAGTLRITTRDSVWTFDRSKKTLTSSARASASHSVAGEKKIIVHDSIDDGSSVWLATNHGLYKKRKEIRLDEPLSAMSDGITSVTSRNGLTVEDVRCILRDVEGNIWCGTPDGLFLYTPDRVASFTPNDGIPPSHGVWSIAESPDGSYWLGTIGGGAIQIRDAKVVRTITQRDGLGSNDVAGICVQSPDRIIFATRGGVTFMDGKTLRTLTTRDGMPSNEVEFIVPSKQGGYWFSTHAGLVRYANGSLQSFTTRDGLPSNRVTQIVEDAHGILWIGTHRGAASFNPVSDSSIDPIVPLLGLRVASVYLDHKGDAWFGTVGSGVYRYSFGALLHITRDDGLAGNTIYFVAQDSLSTYYFGTNSGVSVLPLLDLDTFSERDSSMIWCSQIDQPSHLFHRLTAFHRLTTSHGLAGNEMNSGAVLFDRHNGMWFGSIGGVSRYAPVIFSHEKLPPNVIVRHVRVGSLQKPPGDAITMHHDDYLLMIRCTAPTFFAPEHARMLYKLDGYEFNWHESPDGWITYSGLTPGDYNLVIAVCDGEGRWSATESIMTVTVIPPFHQRPWFWILCVVAAIAAGFCIHRARLRHALALERIRTRIASDLHDDVGATLSSISLLSDVERRTHASERLDRIAAMARSAASSMSDAVWMINPHNDNMDATIGRMRAVVESFASTPDIRIEFTAAEELTNVHLDPERRKNLYLIFKEALNNAMKHSGATTVTCDLSLESHAIVMTICDNGHGFDGSSAHEGNGLRTMRRRTDALHGELNVDSSERGTTITLRCQL